MGKPLAIAIATAVTVIGGAAVVVLGSAPPPPEYSCAPAGTAAYSGPVPDIGTLTADQTRAAATIWQTAHQVGSGKLHGDPDDAAVIAIAVAHQESSLGGNPDSHRPDRNGDAGLFAQRTKPGWYGTLAQVTDHSYATRTFLLGHTVTAAEAGAAVAVGSKPAGPAGYHIPGLADVDHWPQLSAIDAAHAVQRSAFPAAVADHLPIARQLVAAFASGAVDDPATANLQTAACAPLAALTCEPTDNPAEHGLTPDALRVMRCGQEQFPEIQNWLGTGDRPANVDRDHQEGRAVDAMLPGDHHSAAARQLGTSIAQWAVDNHEALGVKYVIWDQQIWSTARADEGWRACGSSAASCYAGPSDTQAHRDHVHISVLGHAGGTDSGGIAHLSGAPGRTTVPVEHFVITAHFGQVGSWARYHTGLDLAAPIGTPIRAAAAGTITHAGPGGAANGWAGNWIAIAHADGTHTLYAHLSHIDVAVGQTVASGARIGAIGVTGRSFGPHLHLEVYPAGTTPGDIYKATDPAAWLTTNGARLSA